MEGSHCASLSSTNFRISLISVLSCSEKNAPFASANVSEMAAASSSIDVKKSRSNESDDPSEFSKPCSDLTVHPDGLIICRLYTIHNGTPKISVLKHMHPFNGSSAG